MLGQGTLPGRVKVPQVAPCCGLDSLQTFPLLRERQTTEALAVRAGIRHLDVSIFTVGRSSLLLRRRLGRWTRIVRPLWQQRGSCPGY